MTAITPTVTFASLTGPIQLSNLDTNFTQLATALNSIANVGTSGTVTVGPPTSGTAFVATQSVSATQISFSNCSGDFVGYANSYVQVDVHNSYAGSSASSDFIATADTGSDTTLYVDFGINSSAFSDSTWTISGALDGYVYASDGVLTVGTKGSKSLIFHTGGTLAANIRGTCTSTGVWSINASSVYGNVFSIAGSTTTGGAVLGISNAASTSAYTEYGGNGNALGGANTCYIGQDSAGSLALNNRSAGTAYIATSGNQRFVVGATGQVSINAPSSGTAFSVTGISGSYAMLTTNATSGVNSETHIACTNGTDSNLLIQLSQVGASTKYTYIGSSVSSALYLGTANTTRMTISSTGACTHTGTLGWNGASGAAAVSGWGTPTGATVVANFSGSAATLVNCSNAIAYIITQMKAHGMFAA